ncbi:hypothetical protein [Vibrio barjaei]|uniref:hypothetical protein n=1 Tax=Vibrio barjaei TaxID=1676683 RepID=UPI0022833D6C|nr:hypothetical protein [Vibrio barjaei]MCY9872366.1 hypothetical protein [Vibrio barjaei]
MSLLNNEQAKAALSIGKKLTHANFTSGEWVRGVGYRYEFEDGCKCDPEEFWCVREDFSPTWRVID